jgi:hypothetical protein
MAKPGSIPTWATDPSAVLTPAPTTGQQAVGWTVSQRPPRSVLNWWMNLVGQWASYLNTITNESLTWAAKHTFAAGVDLFAGDLSLVQSAQQRIRKTLGKLQAGTGDANDFELLRADVVMLALTAAGVDAKNSALLNVGRVLLQNNTADPTSPPEGAVWCRSDLHRVIARLGGVSVGLATDGIDGGGSIALNGFWTRSAFHAPVLQKMSSGLVLFSAALTSPVLSPPDLVATLPGGYWPVEDVSLVCSDGSNPSKTMHILSANGEVHVPSAATLTTYSASGTWRTS